jgi:hypothetical protein
MTVGSAAATGLLEQLHNLGCGVVASNGDVHFYGPFDNTNCDEFNNEQYRVDPSLPTITTDDRPYITQAARAILIKYNTAMMSIWYETPEEFYNSIL